jgi:hypothetical protein
VIIKSMEDPDTETRSCLAGVEIAFDVHSWKLET